MRVGGSYGNRQLKPSATTEGTPFPGGKKWKSSTTLAECICATVFQGFVFGSTDTVETAAEG